MMLRISESCAPQGGKAALLSIRPRFANLILSGDKRVEFRRAWPRDDVRHIVFYSSSPVQLIVGLATVEIVFESSSRQLWEVAKEYGGGLTREELRQYLAGKEKSYGIVLKDVVRATTPIEPSLFIPDFVAPQSYRYLPEDVLEKISLRMKEKGMSL